MPENVIIDQIQWSSDLPKWATEKTQQAIAEALGAHLKEQKKQGVEKKKSEQKSSKDRNDTTTLLEKGFKLLSESIILSIIP